MTSPTASPDSPKPGLHPRNRHREGYDFAALTAAVPGLARFVVTTPAGTPSIDFSNPAAVKTLNRALLEVDYGVRDWDIPGQYLCPAIPGRADLLHHLADLLAEENGGAIHRGEGVRALDIGVGANGVYPLVGHAEYGWRFVGVDTDPLALANLRRIVAANPGLGRAIELRHQPVADNIFIGVLRTGDKFDLSLCNPPFHASPAEAAAAAQRKWKNLGKAAKGGTGPRLNFGGKSNELWYPGGERPFLERMIEQSAGIPKRCLWFTTLVSKAENLPHLEAALAKLRPTATRVIPMAQGQKQSRLLAWTFTPKAERVRWMKARWRPQPG
ncbi:MAG TPA: 23S rRNA (adenine(1618)-N(6))-methyltransferase RlmF [Rhodocyclaceae bacterium]|nr:23S rRNA (adenine(1618)-N(6))-methyltransferase RlmF [Rhodocyclaceae bacterium]